VCWGSNNHGQCNVPTGLGKVVGISCGDEHTVVVTEAGTVICWGDNETEQCNVSAGCTT
jgi:alpha-tubulin suppressor-like RCC1 family protein